VDTIMDKWPDEEVTVEVPEDVTEEVTQVMLRPPIEPSIAPMYLQPRAVEHQHVPETIAPSRRASFMRWGSVLVVGSVLNAGVLILLRAAISGQPLARIARIAQFANAASLAPEEAPALEPICIDARVAPVTFPLAIPSAPAADPRAHAFAVPGQEAKTSRIVKPADEKPRAMAPPPRVHSTREDVEAKNAAAKADALARAQLEAAR
jgi:hypothetical protein